MRIRKNSHDEQERQKIIFFIGLGIILVCLVFLILFMIESGPTNMQNDIIADNIIDKSSDKMTETNDNNVSNEHDVIEEQTINDVDPLPGVDNEDIEDEKVIAEMINDVPEDEGWIELINAEELLDCGIDESCLTSLPDTMYQYLATQGITDLKYVVYDNKSFENKSKYIRVLFDTVKDDYKDVIFCYDKESKTVSLSLYEFPSVRYGEIMKGIEDKEQAYNTLYTADYSDEMTDNIITIVNKCFFKSIGEKAYEFAFQSLDTDYISELAPNVNYGYIEFAKKCDWLRKELGCTEESLIHPKLLNYYIFDDYILVKERLMEYKVIDGKKVSGIKKEIWVTLTKQSSTSFDYDIVFEDINCVEDWKEIYCITN